MGFCAWFGKRTLVPRSNSALTGSAPSKASFSSSNWLTSAWGGNTQNSWSFWWSKIRVAALIPLVFAFTTFANFRNLLTLFLCDIACLRLLSTLIGPIRRFHSRVDRVFIFANTILNLGRTYVFWYKSLLLIIKHEFEYFLKFLVYGCCSQFFLTYFESF